MDAVHVLTQQRVMLKRVDTEQSELVITLNVASNRHEHPLNRSIPFLDVILLPDSDQECIMVTPLLARIDGLPRMETYGELLVFIKSILEVCLCWVLYDPIHVILGFSVPARETDRTPVSRVVM